MDKPLRLETASEGSGSVPLEAPPPNWTARRSVGHRRELTDDGSEDTWVEVEPSTLTRSTCSCRLMKGYHSAWPWEFSRTRR